ncbi:MAG: YDG domain-containing protein, partial [Pseudomonadota bacterium]
SSATFASKTVGTGKTVSVAGINVTGIDATNYTFNTTASTTASITAKALTLGGVTASNKVYDGLSTASISGGTLSGTIAGDTVSFSLGSATFANKNVGTAKTVTATGTSLSGTDSANYSITDPSSLTANITAKGLTVSTSSINKVYDGNTTASITLGDDRIAGDTLTLSNSSATFANKTVGTGKTVSVAGINVTGTDSTNYTFNTTASTTANITAKALTLSGVSASNKVYDALTAASLSGGTLSGTIAGDTVSFSLGSATFANKNVGTAKTVTATGTSLSGTDSANYSITDPSSLTANITAKGLTVSASGINKVYDGTTTASVTLGDDRIAGDTLTLSNSSATFANKTVGTGKTVSVAGINVTGTNATNYTFNTTASTTADITAKALTLGGVTASNKVYDGLSTASISGGTLSGMIAGDTASFSLGSATFSDKNVGIAKGITLASASLSGIDANNYSVSIPSSIKADITPKVLTINGTFASNKTYDGNTTASVLGGSLVGVIGNEIVDFTLGSASFLNKNIGMAKDIALASATLSGINSGNYAVTLPSALKADITPKALTIEGTQALSKIYDGNTNASLLGGSLVGVIGNESVNFKFGSAVFSDKNVGTLKNVTLSSATLTGNDAANYLVNISNNFKADITAKTLTIANISAANKVYDGNTTATVSGSLLSGVIQNDIVNLSLGSAAFFDKNVGLSKAITLSNVSLTGIDANNYLVVTPSDLTANISNKPITISGIIASNKNYDGTTTAQIKGGSLSGLVINDNLSFVLGSGSFSDKNAGSSKAITITGSQLLGQDAANYALFEPTGITADINNFSSIVPTPVITALNTPLNTNLLINRHDEKSSSYNQTLTTPLSIKISNPVDNASSISSIYIPLAKESSFKSATTDIIGAPMGIIDSSSHDTKSEELKLLIPEAAIKKTDDVKPSTPEVVVKGTQISQQKAKDNLSIQPSTSTTECISVDGNDQNCVKLQRVSLNKN